MTDGPSQPHHHRREDPRTGGQQHDPGQGLPAVGAQRQRAVGEVARHTEHRILSNREDVGDHGKAHGDADDHGVALVKADTQNIGHIDTGITTEQPVLHHRRQRECPPANEHHRQDGHGSFPAIRHPLLDAGRQLLPGDGGQQDADGQRDQHHHYPRQVVLNHWRQPQTREEAEEYIENLKKTKRYQRDVY